MNRQPKTIKEAIFTPDDLKVFEGWEIRGIYTDRPAVAVQNPETGERRKIILNVECFDGKHMTVLRRDRRICRLA